MINPESLSFCCVAIECDPWWKWLAFHYTEHCRAVYFLCLRNRETVQRKEWMEGRQSLSKGLKCPTDILQGKVSISQAQKGQGLKRKKKNQQNVNIFPRVTKPLQFLSFGFFFRLSYESYPSCPFYLHQLILNCLT